MNEIISGDCLEEMKKIADKSVNLILSDLPYAVTSRNEWDNIIPVKDMWAGYERIIKDNGAIVLTAIQPFTSLLVSSNLKLFKYEWIWEKQQGTGFLNAKKQPLRNHESVLVFYKKQPTYNPQFTEGKPYIAKKGSETMNYGKHELVTTVNAGYRYPLTVQKFNYDKDKLHPTQKPLKLFEYLIKTYTNENDLVFDGCAGSGTTGLAAKNLNRNYILVEKEEKYYNICKERLKND
jgi:site-specific DNA-methyltransferase (adenine-specific)